MHKALYPIIKEMSSNMTTLKGTFQTARDIQLDIKRKLKAMRLNREISFRDVMQASTIIMKKVQEAPSNMCVVTSYRNYYTIMPTKYIKETRSGRE